MTDPAIVSALRKQYPGYEDIKDDEFVNGVHQVYFKDVPQQDFEDGLREFYKIPKPVSLGETLKTTGDLMGSGAIGPLPQAAVTAGQGILGAATHPLETASAIGKGIQIAGKEIGKDLSSPITMIKELSDLGGTMKFAQEQAQFQGTITPATEAKLEEHARAATKAAGRASAFIGSTAAAVATGGAAELALPTRLAAVMAEGGVGVGAYTAITDSVEGKSAGETALETALSIPIGAVGGAVLHGAGLLLGKGISSSIAETAGLGRRMAARALEREAASRSAAALVQPAPDYTVALRDAAIKLNTPAERVTNRGVGPLAENFSEYIDAMRDGNMTPQDAAGAIFKDMEIPATQNDVAALALKLHDHLGGGPMPEPPVVEGVGETANTLRASHASSAIPMGTPVWDAMGIPMEVVGHSADGRFVLRSTAGKTGVASEGEITTQQPTAFLALLTRAEKGAKARIASRGVRLYDITGVGEELTDHAIVGAAMLARLGANGSKDAADLYARWAGSMLDRFGPDIRPHLEQLFKESQKQYSRHLSSLIAPAMLKAQEELNRARALGYPGYDWYNKTLATFTAALGQRDGEMITRFLAALSGHMSTEANNTLAVKAFAQWKVGADFQGFMGNQMKALQRAVAASADLGGTGKISGHQAALLADPEGVAFDMHVLKVLGVDKKSLTTPQYDFLREYFRTLVQDEHHLNSAEAQATLWALGKGDRAMAEGSEGNHQYTSSFRPHEEILTGGAPDVAKIQAKIGQVVNVERGIQNMFKPMEEGGGGYTYEPGSFETFRGDGYLVGLMSAKARGAGIPVRDFDSSTLLSFYDRVKPVIEEYADRVPLKIGLWLSDNKVYVDLTANVTDELTARALGKETKQQAVGHFLGGSYDPAGELALRKKPGRNPVQSTSQLRALLKEFFEAAAQKKAA